MTPSGEWSIASQLPVHMGFSDVVQFPASHVGPIEGDTSGIIHGYMTVLVLDPLPGHNEPRAAYRKIDPQTHKQPFNRKNPFERSI